MGIIALITAVIPLLLKVLGLFIKTPEDKRADAIADLNTYVESITAGVKKSEEVEGDTSGIEDAINKH